jgi:hypothetical protein
MLLCPDCKLEYEEDKKFCKACGTKLVPKESAINPTPLSSKSEKGLTLDGSEHSVGTPLITIEHKCFRCGVEYEEGKKFCKNCGTPLETKEEPSAGHKNIEETKDEKSKEMKVCPRCNAPNETGKFCKKCGSTLVSQESSQKKEELQAPPLFEGGEELSEVQSLGKKYIKKLSQEWLTLSEEKKKLEYLVKNLQARQSTISQDVFNTTFERYQAQLMSVSSNHQQIEKSLESVKTKTLAAISLMVKELTPIKKKVEEVKSLYKSGAITKADFSQGKKELKKDIKLRESAIKNHRAILSALPVNMGGKVSASKGLKYLLRPLPIAAAVIIILIAGGGGYLLWGKYSHLIIKPKEVISGDNVAAPITPKPTSNNETIEVEKMKSLFENIRLANFQKDIDLFMSCYALDFNDREGKKITTLENWDKVDYLDLTYNLQSQSISGDTANARVEWSIRCSSRSSGQTQESKTVLDVKLKKENGAWKIQETIPVS